MLVRSSGFAPSSESNILESVVSAANAVRQPTLTSDQAAFLEAVPHYPGHNYLVGGPSTGKTTALVQLAVSRAPARRGLFIVRTAELSRQLDRELLLRAPGVEVTTLVGLGVRLAKPAMRASLVHALCPTAISSQLNISKSNAEAALRILDIFCQSADTDIDERHLSNLDRVFAGSVLDILDKVDAARKLWQDIVDGKFSVTRDAIFKMMSLDAPALLVDDIYVDDAEDLTPAQIHFLQQQVHARIIWAGDPEQQLQGNLAALDASARLGPVTILNQSFRMTPEVADLCNLVAAGSPAGLAKAGLDQSPLLLKGGCDFLALSRFNVQKSVVIARWDSTLLSMAFETMGEGVHWVGGCDAVARAFAIYYLWKGCDETMTLPSDEMSSQSRTDDVTAFSSYALLKDFAIHTHNQQLLVLTEIVEKYAESTPQIALRILRNAVPRMDDPGCREIYATPERAKGMRWESVTLAQDFRGDVSDPAERALLYLACSRAEVNVTGPGLWTSKWF